MNPDGLIVVVDRRTYRHARNAIPLYIERGDWTRAKALLVNSKQWLRQYRHDAWTRRRREWAAVELAEVQMIEHNANGAMGLPSRLVQDR